MNFLNMAINKMGDRLMENLGNAEKNMGIGPVDASKPRFEPIQTGQAPIQATQQQEAQARAAGFPSYEAMINWQRRRSDPNNTGSVPAKGSMPGSMGEAADNALSWHPKNLLERVVRAFQSAD